MEATVTEFVMDSLDVDECSAVSTSASVSSSKNDASHSELTILEEKTGHEGSDKVRVNYKEFFEHPETRPTTHFKCLARCRLCRKVYKFTLTTKGNLLKHLQTAHTRNLCDHKVYDQPRFDMDTNQVLD